MGRFPKLVANQTAPQRAWASTAQLSSTCPSNIKLMYWLANPGNAESYCGGTPFLKLLLNMNKSCGCPYGCCSCGAVDDNKTDVFYDCSLDQFFFLEDGASASSPLGWEISNPNLIYLGKLGDNYLEYIGRMTLHELTKKESL